jgi:integrase
MRDVPIHRKGERAKLPARREPFWAAPLATNCSLGFRKISDDSGTWIARFKKEDGTRNYKRLGKCTDIFDFPQAKDQAIKWFKDLERGIVNDDATVESACKAYVEDRRAEVSEANAHDAEMRFQRTVYGTPLGRIALAKLQSTHVKAWRNNLVEPTDKRGISKSACNRTLTSLRAALNLAVEHRLVPADRVIEWSSVEAYKNAGQRRDLFLDLGQRRQLLKAATGHARDLIEAVVLTGARPGELRHALRQQFDARTESMRFIGKTGTRTVPLSPAAMRLFTRLAKDKLPAAYLFTRDDGKPWKYSSDWDQLVRDAAKKAELPSGVCLYVLRHSFITEAITSGMTTLDVARLCGTSVMMIERHYGHLVDSHVREKLAKVVMA